jgi:hypothetical protein
MSVSVSIIRASVMTFPSPVTPGHAFEFCAWLLEVVLDKGLPAIRDRYLPGFWCSLITWIASESSVLPYSKNLRLHISHKTDFVSRSLSVFLSRFYIFVSSKRCTLIGRLT